MRLDQRQVCAGAAGFLLAGTYFGPTCVIGKRGKSYLYLIVKERL